MKEVSITPMTTKKKKTKLKATKKQRKLLEGIAKGKSKGKAAKDAGYKHVQAATAVTSSRRTQAEFEEFVDSKISDDKIIENFVGLTEAEKPYGKNATPGPDNTARISANQTLLKLKGRLIEKHQVIGGLDINLEIKASEAALKVAGMLKEWWEKHYRGLGKLPNNFVTEDELVGGGE